MTAPTQPPDPRVQRIADAFRYWWTDRDIDQNIEDFARVLGTADALVLAEVYAAGEAPIVAADGRSLARAIRVAGKIEPLEQVVDGLVREVKTRHIARLGGKGAGQSPPHLSHQLVSASVWPCFILWPT